MKISKPNCGLKVRAGSGHFFSGPGRVQAGVFWPRAISGRRFVPIFADFLAKRAILEVRAGSGHPKSGPGRATQNPWPAGRLSVRV